MGASAKTISEIFRFFNKIRPHNKWIETDGASHRRSTFVLAEFMNFSFFKSRWSPFQVELFCGSYGTAKILMSNVPCERNEKNGKIRYQADWGNQFNLWFSQYCSQNGNDANRIYGNSPLHLQIEISGYPTVIAKVEYSKRVSFDEMYSDTLDAMIEALGNTANQSMEDNDLGSA